MWVQESRYEQMCVWKWRIRPLKVVDSASLRKCGGLKQLSINKDGSMKTGVKGGESKAVWRTMAAAAAALLRTSCCHDAALHVNALAPLEPSCCSVAGSQLIRSSVNDHKKQEPTPKHTSYKMTSWKRIKDTGKQAAHLIARYMGRMANKGNVWTLIMIVMKAMYSRTLMKPGRQDYNHLLLPPPFKWNKRRPK